MLRKCFEFLGLVESKKKKPVWISQRGCGTIDGIAIMRLLSDGQKKRKGLLN